MLTATDPMDMTPEDRRREVAAVLAAGFLRLKCRPAQPPDPPDSAKDAAMSPPDATSAAPDAATRPRRNRPEFSRN